MATNMKMSSISSSSTYNARTYGRKSLAKRKQSIDAAPAVKRRKVSVEREPSPSTEIGEDSHEPLPSPPRVLRTYGSPKRQEPSPIASRGLGIAKDLSAIFQAATPTSSPLSSPTKLASRMLSRSKTDSSIDSSPSRNVDRTPSLPNFSSSPPKPSTSRNTDPPPPPPIPIPTNNRTYAGKSRSFLVAIPSSTLDPAFPGVEDEDDSNRESYASLRSRWGVDNSEDDPYFPYPNASPSRSDSTATPTGSPTKSARIKAKARQEALHRPQLTLPNGMMNPLKSITELRSKGESRRFLDEVGYLFEGMDASGGLGLRRASALEITTKLCDADFARKAKAADFLSRIWDVFSETGAGKGEDKVLDTLLAFFSALVSRDNASLTDLAQRSTAEPDEDNLQNVPSLVDTLFSLLNKPSDPLVLVSPSLSKDRTTNDTQLKKIGVGKKDRALFITIHDAIVSKSSLFPADTPISTPLLLTCALQTLPSALISTNHFPTLLSSLRQSLSNLVSANLSSSAHLAWPDVARDLPYQSIYYHLQMLDVYLLGQWSDAPVGADEEDVGDTETCTQAENERILHTARQEWLADALIALGVCAELSGKASARNCTETILRVLVSLTHSDEMWGRKVLECECALGFIIRLILGSHGDGQNIKVEVKEDEDGIKDIKKGKEIMKQELDGDTFSPNGEEPEVKDIDGATNALDRLCLALGLLTNLVQVVDSTKDLLRETRFDPSCILKKRACIRRCTCSSLTTARRENAPTNALDVIVRLYKAQLSPSTGNSNSTVKVDGTPPLDTDTADTLFLRGHLAVLLGLLMRGNPTNQAYILAALGVSAASNRVALARLVEQAREFVAFYAALGGAGNRVDGSADERDGRVARDVVQFLAELRDTART